MEDTRLDPVWRVGEEALAGNAILPCSLSFCEPFALGFWLVRTCRQSLQFCACHRIRNGNGDSSIRVAENVQGEMLEWKFSFSGSFSAGSLHAGFFNPSTLSCQHP